jgi:hypothetical protein
VKIKYLSDGDQRIGGHQHQFPEDVEQEHIVGQGGAGHPNGKKHQQGVENRRRAIWAVVAPGVDDRQQRHGRLGEQERESQPIQVQRHADAGHRDPFEP